MAKTDQSRAREQRLAAKLRENLKRRKRQQRARDSSEARAPADAGPGPGRKG